MKKTLAIVIVTLALTANAAAQNARKERHHASEETAKKTSVTAEKDAAFPGTAYSYPIEDFHPGVVRVGPSSTYLKEGLTTEEVVRFLGQPSSVSERMEGETTVTVYQFQRSETRVVTAEFVKGRLVRSQTQTVDTTTR